MTRRIRAIGLALLAAWVLGGGDVGAQAPPPLDNPAANYVIGPDDVLSVLFWRDKDMSYDVVVRPDGTRRVGGSQRGRTIRHLRGREQLRD